MKFLRRVFPALIGALLLAYPAFSSIVPSIPYNLTNGTTADASQVMGNFNTVVNDVNANGAPLNSPTFTGAVTVPNLTNNGNETVAGTLGVTGATTLSSSISVTGNVTLSSALSVGTTAAVTGPVTLSSTLDVTGTTSVPSLNVSGLTASGLVGTDGSKNLSIITALPSGTTATTQSVNDASTKVATTKFANPAASLASPGYSELPSGAIIQWANMTTSTAFIDWTYPKAFATGATYVNCTYNSTSLSGGIFFQWDVAASTATTAHIGTTNISGTATAFNVYCIAVGY